jgi:3-oxoacyl-[acyl-carrier protein] reductase
MMLHNKVAIVTGANRGIGQTIARTFVAQGAFVYACMRTVDQAILKKIAGTEASDRVQGISLDLSDEASIKSAIKDIMATTKKIDILVNNAGTASGGLFQMTGMAELRRVFEVNFYGQILLTQSISRLMARNCSGSIINISSTAADIPDPGTLSYGASKAAFARASRSMATELGSAGIRVNAISPGVTKTDMFDQMTPEARERLISTSAFKRAAEPQDIANAALFLASDLSAFVTGQTLRVDGGMI